MGQQAWILVWCALVMTAAAREDARPTEGAARGDASPTEGAARGDSRPTKGEARPPVAQIDATKLPPAATNRIDFARDVQPILERSCLHCHGPERPKSKFRLDNRVAALQGGEDNREDVIPGDS